jgi:hypothetical protein
MSKTYTETKNNDPFNWNQALSNSDITLGQWEDMENRANDWVTCAVGNQCAVIPRDEYGSPLDEELEWQGLSFMMAIQNRDIDEAKDVLRSIEMRSAELIALHTK